MAKQRTIRPGSSLEHPAAHEREHQAWSRRDVLRTLGLTGAGGFVFNNLAVGALTASPLAYLLDGVGDDRILVLIRLKGGNDGLNTIIPVYDYGRYQASRPTVAIPRNDIIALNEAFGMPKTMAPLEAWWKNGGLRVVHSVGYPEQNLSHFRSSDIWATASDAQVLDQSGWLGRWLDDLYPDYLLQPPAVPPAIQIGSNGVQIFNDEAQNSLSVALSNPEELERIAREGQLYDTQAVPDCLHGEQLAYVRSVANSTFRYAGVIAQAYGAGANQANYGQGPLQEQLALVARLIKGRLGTRLYLVTLEGFDTHAKQNEYHPNLLGELAKAVTEFLQDLKGGGWADKVLLMTYSEFGRRIEQNASNGTDHGAAAPLLLFGSGLNGSGLVGRGPSLTAVDEVGNLQFDTDFRQIYATLLERWLCLPAAQVDQVLGRSFPRLPGLGLQCNTSTATAQLPPQSLPMSVVVQQQTLRLQLELPQGGPAQLQLINVLGQVVQQQQLGWLAAGKQELQWPLPLRLPVGPYVLLVQAGRARGSAKVQLGGG